MYYNQHQANTSSYSRGHRTLRLLPLLHFPHFLLQIGTSSSSGRGGLIGVVKLERLVHTLRSDAAGLRLGDGHCLAPVDATNERVRKHPTRWVLECAARLGAGGSEPAWC
jgi:hypothetical protein